MVVWNLDPNFQFEMEKSGLKIRNRNASLQTAIATLKDTLKLPELLSLKSETGCRHIDPVDNQIFPATIAIWSNDIDKIHKIMDM